MKLFIYRCVLPLGAQSPKLSLSTLVLAFASLVVLAGTGYGQTTFAVQGFEAVAAQPPWATSSTAGDTGANSGTDTPANQRVRSGTVSYQTNNETNTLTLAQVPIPGNYTNVRVLVRISATSTNATDGMDATDFLRVTAALNGAAFPAAGTYDIQVTGAASPARWGYNDAINASTTAGVPLSVSGTAGTNAGTIYSTLEVVIPTGTTSVALRVIASSNTAQEVWNVDDIVLEGTPPASTVVGANAGAVPDSPGAIPTCGTPRDVTFSVSGVPVVGSVEVDLSFSHTYIGDLEMSLISPSSTSLILFSRVGANAAGDNGDSSNMLGTYRFRDPAAGNIWSAALGGADAFNIPGGDYRTQAAGPFVNDDPGPAFTSLNSTFGGETGTGTWTLRVVDCANVDTGTVFNANITVLGPSAADASVSGRVVTANGRGIPGAYVRLDGGSLGEGRMAVTNSFGRYRFEGIPAGESYIISVRAKRYQFAEPAWLISLDADAVDVEFVAIP